MCQSGASGLLFQLAYTIKIQLSMLILILDIFYADKHETDWAQVITT